jgi:hypothetical protein
MVVNTGPGEISEPVCRTVPIEEAQQGLGDDGQEIGIPRVVGGILVKGLLDLLPPGQSVVVVGTPDDAP